MIVQDIGCACTMAAGGNQDIGFKLKKKLKRAMAPKRIIKRAVLMPKKVLKATLKPQKALLRLAGQKKAAQRLDGVIDQSTDTIVQVATKVADPMTSGGASAILAAAGMSSTDNQAEPAPYEPEPASFPFLPVAAVAGGVVLLVTLLRR